MYWVYSFHKGYIVTGHICLDVSPITPHIFTFFISVELLRHGSLTHHVGLLLPPRGYVFFVH